MKWIGLVVVVALSGCASMQISYDYDGDVDFSSLHSYAWLPTPQVKSGDPKVQYGSLLDSRVKALVEEQLAARGFVKNADKPDVLVTYHVAIEDKTSVTYTNELYGYGPGWGTGYRRNMLHHGYPGSTAMVTEYQQGTLILDVVRSSDKQLIWRGTAIAEIYPDLSKEAREKRLREAVDSILANFPPPATGSN